MQNDEPLYGWKLIFALAWMFGFCFGVWVFFIWAIERAAILIIDQMGR